MKKGGGSESTIIVGPSKFVLVYALHSLEYVLGLARFRVFVPKLYYYIILQLLRYLQLSKVITIDLLIPQSQLQFAKKGSFSNAFFLRCIHLICSAALNSQIRKFSTVFWPPFFYFIAIFGKWQKFKLLLVIYYFQCFLPNKQTNGKQEQNFFAVL